MSYLLGKDAKLYSATIRATWGAAGADGYTHEGAAPGALTLMSNIKDLAFSMEKSEADVTTRANGGWEAILATLKKGELTFQMVYDTADAGVLLMQKSFFMDTTVPLAVLDGDKATVGTRGIWADWQVTKFSKSENLADAQMVDVALKPTYSSVAPEAIKVTA